MQLTAFSSLGDCYQCFLKLIDESFLTNSIVVRQIFVSLVDQRTNQCLKVRHQFHGDFDKMIHNLLRLLLLVSTYSHTKPLVYANLFDVVILSFSPIHQLIYFSYPLVELKS